MNMNMRINDNAGINTLRILVTKRREMARQIERIDRTVEDFDIIIKTHQDPKVVELAKEKKNCLSNAKVLCEYCINKLDICIQKDRDGEDYSDDLQRFVSTLMQNSIVMQQLKPYLRR